MPPVTSKLIKLSGSAVFAVLIAGIIVAVVVHLQDSLAWLLVACGLAIGWAAGILLSPYQSETQRFKEYLRLSAAFLTGYAVSKADRVFELLIDPAHGLLLLQPIIAARTIVAINSFFLAMVLTYVSRKYVSFGPGAERSQVPQGAASPQSVVVLLDTGAVVTIPKPL
jgi:hypothetical protein